MRQSFLAVAVAAVAGFAVASCGNKSKSTGTDMGGGGGSGGLDMTVAKANCLGFGVCVYNCLVSMQGDLNSCIQTICPPTAKPNSGTLWLNAFVCGQNYCTGDVDAGTGKCNEPTVQTDMGPMPGGLLCDPGVTYDQCNSSTYMSTVCSPCLEQARNFWIYDASVDPNNPGPPTGMCPNATSADCMAAQTQCMQAFAACRNDQ